MMARQNKPACRVCGGKRERNLIAFYSDDRGLSYVCLYCLLGGSSTDPGDVRRVKAVNEWLITGSEWFDDNHISVITSENQTKEIVKVWCNA